MKNEIKKCFFSKTFIFIFIIGIVIAIFHSYRQIITYNDFIEAYKQSSKEIGFISNPYAPITTSFSLWIGNDKNNYIAKIYYFLFPLISFIPCASLFVSKKSNDKTYENRKSIAEKYFAIFTSSGLLMIITPLLDFIITSLFVPSIYPDSIYDIYYGIFSNDFFSSCFYGAPYLYIILSLLIDFAFCGLFGCMAYAISILIKRKIISIIIPLIILILIEVLDRFYLPNIVISPLSFMYPSKSINCNWIIILCEFSFLFLTSFYICVLRKIKISKNPE